MNFTGRLQTSLTIIRHSFGIMIRHPMLLAFPAVGALAGWLAYEFFLGPRMEAEFAARREQWNPEEGWQWMPFGRADGDFPELAAFYLLSMFFATFLNVALYSQIIAVMNGGRVSVLRGLALASARVPAIAGWSLLAGTVGLILRAIQERTGFLGRWIAGVAGISWSAASVFVIPVIINEPRTRNPLDYLRISSALLRRVWGEGVIGLAGVVMLAVLVALCLMAFSLGVSSVAGVMRMQMMYAFAIGTGVTFILFYLAWQIFECALYVYATEGVAPGTFDEELFQRAWVVGRGAGRPAPLPAARRNFRWKPWLVVPAVAGLCVVLWFSQFFQSRPPQIEPAGPEVGRLVINLAGLEYSLEFSDLQAAGLFAGQQREGCEFPAEASLVMLNERVEGKISVAMGRLGDHLYFTFYDENAATGPARVEAVRDALRSQFRGRDDAINVISPGERMSHVPRMTLAQWPAVAGAASYTLEIDCMHCCGRDRWCTDVGSKWQQVPGLTGTSHEFEFVGSQPGRWRVWSVDAAGRQGRKSDWTNFDFSYSACGRRVNNPG